MTKGQKTLAMRPVESEASAAGYCSVYLLLFCMHETRAFVSEFMQALFIFTSRVTFEFQGVVPKLVLTQTRSSRLPPLLSNQQDPLHSTRSVKYEMMLSYVKKPDIDLMNLPSPGA